MRGKIAIMHRSQIRYERREQCLPSITEAQSTSWVAYIKRRDQVETKRSFSKSSGASMKSWGIFTRSKLAHALDKTFTLTLWQCLDFFEICSAAICFWGSGPMQAFSSQNILKINSHRDGAGYLLPAAALPEFTAARIIVRHHDNDALNPGPA